MAAARLALLYACGVALLFGVLITATEGPRELGRAFADLLQPAAGLFAVAFALLGIARRAGFVALWLLLLGLWLWATVTNSHMIVEDGFLAWTVLALPLYLLAAIGTQSPVMVQIAKLRVRLGTLVSVAWVVLVLLALYYERATPYVQDGDGLPGAVPAGTRPVWLAAPYVVAAYAILHVWVGLAGGNAKKRLHN